MIQALQPKLSNLKIVLASTSPRRRDILNQAGLQFKVVPSSFEETLNKSDFDSATAYVLENAKQKALDVGRTMERKEEPFDLVIGADTVVVLDNVIMEKPKNEESAVSMLTRLSGSVHQVHSGVSFVSRKLGQDEFAVRQFHEITRVEFGVLDSDTIKAYVATGEPLDKAGAYGIQGIGGTLVKAIQGDYYNVVGFPLFKFCQELNKWIGERADD